MIISEALNILDLPKDYNITELKKKYRTLAIKYHPDKYSGPPETFLKINDAYNLLLKKLESPNGVINFGTLDGIFEDPIIEELNKIFQDMMSTNNIRPSGVFIRIQRPFNSSFNPVDILKNINQNIHQNIHQNIPVMQPIKKNVNETTIITITPKEYLTGFTKVITKKIQCNCEPIMCNDCLCLGLIDGNICETCIGNGYCQNCNNCKYGIIYKKVKITFKGNMNDLNYSIDTNNSITFKMDDSNYCIHDSKLVYLMKLESNFPKETIIFKDPWGSKVNITFTEKVILGDTYLVKTHDKNIYIYFILP